MENFGLISVFLHFRYILKICWYWSKELICVPKLISWKYPVITFVPPVYIRTNIRKAIANAKYVLNQNCVLTGFKAYTKSIFSPFETYKYVFICARYMLHKKRTLPYWLIFLLSIKLWPLNVSWIQKWNAFYARYTRARDFFLLKLKINIDFSMYIAVAVLIFEIF